MAKKAVGAGKTYKTNPILRSEILEAQRHTNSNRAAAKWLGCSYIRYKRYAEIYGVFQSHMNPKGFGTSKGFAKNPNTITLREIFDNKRPNYSLVRLKYRMLARHLIEDKCNLCGFADRRILDNKSPLMLTFKDKTGDYTKTNLQLLCYNCIFLTTGSPWAAHKNHIKASLTDPNYKPFTKQDKSKPADFLDPIEDAEFLSMDTDALKDEVMQELGRD